MRNHLSVPLTVAAIVVALLITWPNGLRTFAIENEAGSSVVDRAATAPETVDEARGRARLLAETIHGVLQIMHRDFFDEDDPAAIPSASLEDVFQELSKSHNVELRWLIVETDVVNVDHEPQDAFEKQAAKAIGAGKPEYELASNGRFRYAGRIRLASQCLKCHLKNRTSTADRSAGLLISMPIQPIDK